MTKHYKIKLKGEFLYHSKTGIFQGRHNNELFSIDAGFMHKFFKTPLDRTKALLILTDKPVDAGYKCYASKHDYLIEISLLGKYIPHFSFYNMLANAGFMDNYFYMNIRA